MARTVTVALLDSYLGGEITEVVLREPTLDEYVTFGEPVSLVQRGDSLFTVENDAAIKGYLSTLVVQPDVPSYVRKLGLADAMKVKEALLDFFALARGRLRPTAPSSSPSTSDGAASSTPGA